MAWRFKRGSTARARTCVNYCIYEAEHNIIKTRKCTEKNKQKSPYDTKNQSKEWERERKKGRNRMKSKNDCMLLNIFIFTLNIEHIFCTAIFSLCFIIFSSRCCYHKLCHRHWNLLNFDHHDAFCLIHKSLIKRLQHLFLKLCSWTEK